MIISLPIGILVDSKKRLGKLSWTWAIIMFLLCSTFIAAWIDFIHPWLVEDLKPEYAFYGGMFKYIIMLGCYSVFMDFYKRSTMTNAEEALMAEGTEHGKESD